MPSRILAAAALAGVAAGASLRRSSAPAADIVQGSYIAVLQPNSTAMLKSAAQQLKGTAVNIGTFHAVTGRIDLAAALAHPAVQYVEHDEVVRAIGTVKVDRRRKCPDHQDRASWGQSRTTVKTAGEVSDQYIFDEKWGHGVDAYVLDTGVYCEHDELRGHCEWGLTVTGTAGEDRNGHGTHVAGTIGGKTYGVAKSTHIIAVKVLGDGGSGTKEGVIRGTEWSVDEMKKRGRKGVANLSLGGSFSQAQNDAMDAAVDAGLQMAIAAGNSNADTCTSSPASAPKPVTVMSSDRGNNGGEQVDIRSTFSNYGKCADIIAPGSGILSCYIGSPTATASLSGTSMAAPHVAGVIAEFYSQHAKATPQDARDYLLSNSLDDIVDLRCNNGDCRESPNKLLHIAC
eukprot:TRINITY_DN9291_c0_g1_i1.p1 TRINITY_DN9291_c0_g1~~TRINITY_DN9291_c0_g1_i1.p1  ORF type:complete len:419 (+),score=160.91 TRINITY_DN9291_c0_g1_i1:60-1259(+)